MTKYEIVILIFIVVIQITGIITNHILLTKFPRLKRKEKFGPKMEILLIVVCGIIFYFAACQHVKDEYFADIISAEFNSTKATAKLADSFPYGINLELNDGSIYCLDTKHLNKNFIKYINSGYTVSKLRNSTDILLTNGNDSIYYNLYY